MNKKKELKNKLVAKKTFETLWENLQKKRNLEREKFLKDFAKKFFEEWKKS